MSKQALTFSLLILALIAVAWMSVYIGPTNSLDPVILREIRLPRVAIGILVGLSLATAGTTLQGLLRNPLADPYVIGTSSGASVGALIAFQVRHFFPEFAAFSTGIFYFIIFACAFLATMSAYYIARSEKQVSIINLLLSGVIVSTFCGALIFLFFTLQHEESFSVFIFLMGNMTEGNWTLIGTSAGIILVCLIFSILSAKNLNIISLGEEKARHLGVDVEKFKLCLFALNSLMVAAAVAISGTIGFVGLVVPHITRLIVGPNHKVLIPCSALAGAILVLLADDVARVIAKPIEIPVGIIMSMVGAPFFLWLLKKRQKTKYF